MHVATVLSTLAVLWKEVDKLFRGTFTTWRWNTEKNYVAKILVSMIPVFVVGIFFKDQVEAFFGNGLLLVGICLLITAALLALSEWLQRRRSKAVHEVRYLDAFIIGIAQACAVLPGLSRSGTTIATGLLCGVKKDLDGKEFDVTRERIRQIEAKALRKLRHPSRSKKLKDFLEDV